MGGFEGLGREWFGGFGVWMDGVCRYGRGMKVDRAAQLVMHR